MNKTIYDSICSKCGSDNWYQYDADELNFPLMVLVITILIVIVEIVKIIGDNAMNLNILLQRSGIVNAFVAS